MTRIFGRKTPFIRSGGHPDGERCAQCEKWVEAVVVVGEAPDYDSATAALCRACLEKAVRLFASWSPE